LFFYLAAFSVTANLMTPVSVLLGERFAYLPSAGFCIAAAALLTRPLPAPGSLRRLPMAALAILWLVLLGGLLVRRNADFKSDLSLSEVAVRRDPGNARAWFLLGGALRQQGRVEEAEAAFRRSAAGNPPFPDGSVALAHLLLQAGRFEEAGRAARQGLEDFPGGGIPAAYLALAQAEFRLGNPREALAWLDRSAPQYDSRGFFWGLRSEIVESTGDLAGAAAAARRLVELEGGPGSELRLADLLRRGGRVEEAAAILRRTEALLHTKLNEREDPEAMNQYGLSLAWQGEYLRAAAAFRRASELDPASEMYRANLEEALRAAR
jgi:tetratricopeptide (TPR) repeat protein